jgi:hypothetical protein
MASGSLITVANITFVGEIAGTIDLVQTESLIQIPFREPGVISNFCVILATNTVNAVSTIRLRKNGANANSVVNPTANTIGYYEDTTHTDTVAAGDLINYQLVHGASSGTMTPTVVSFVFNPTNSAITHTKFAVNWGAAVNTATTYSDTFNGKMHHTTTSITNNLIKPGIAGVFKHFSLYSSAGGRAITQRLAPNGTDDGVTRATLASNTTGLNEDSSSSLSISATDTIAELHVLGASGTSRTPDNFGLSFENTGNYFLFLCSQGDGVAFTSNLTRYIAPGGAIVNQTTETNVRPKCRIPFQISKMYVRTSSNSLNTGTSTVTLRKNGADTAIVASIPAGASGIGAFEDTADTVSFLDTDDISVKLVTSGSSGSMTLNAVMMLAESVLPSITATSDTKDILRPRPLATITNSI